MKTIYRNSVITAALFLFLWTAQTASAFYAPNLQRWVNRDPIEEEGGMNQFRFLQNSPIDRTDALGLFDGNASNARFFGSPTYSQDLIKEMSKWPCTWKWCGVLVSRATYPSSRFYRAVDNVATSCFAPHMFLMLADGSRLSHGGDATGEDHWSATWYRISIPSTADCAQFTQCVKNYFKAKASEGYSLLGINCHLANEAVRHCGGRALP